MKKWKFALTVILFLFFSTNHSVAFAHEGEEQESDNYLKDFSTNEHDHLDTEEEVTESHNSHDSHKPEDSSNQLDTHDDSNSHNEEGVHGTFTGEETGPNYIVLSSFASVNAGFLLIGIWNKVRKRGNAHGIN